MSQSAERKRKKKRKEKGRNANLSRKEAWKYRGEEREKIIIIKKSTLLA